MIKWAIIFCLCARASAYEKNTITECLWHNSSCIDKCPEGLVEKKNDCSTSYWSAQRTCQNPEQMLVGTVCGYSRCDCPDPMVLDTDTGYCYDVDNCPTNHEEP